MARRTHIAGSQGLQRSAPCAPAHRAAPAAGLLLLVLLMAGCAGGAFVDEKVSTAETDFEARHARLLHAVLDRPGELRSQLAARDRRIRERNLGHWESVIARQDAYFARRQETTQRDETQFLRILELQRKFSETRVEDNSDRWAQFIERSAPAGTAGGNAAP